MAWQDLYLRALGLRRASTYVMVFAAVGLLWTVVVAASAVNKVDDFAAQMAFGSGPAGPTFFDYASIVGSSVMTYAVVTVVLLATGYLLRALALIAEVAVHNLDDELEDDDEDGPVPVVSTMA